MEHGKNKLSNKDCDFVNSKQKYEAFVIKCSKKNSKICKMCSLFPGCVL